MVVVRSCTDNTTHDLGCQSADLDGHSGQLCYCNTDWCNGAAMTSQYGHVITTLALSIDVIIAYLMT